MSKVGAWGGLFLGSLSLGILSRVNLPAAGSAGFFGPFRWWNTEVLGHHVLPGSFTVGSPEAFLALFWSPPIGATTDMLPADGYQTVGGGPELRFLNEGSAYVQTPPLLFFLVRIWTILVPLDHNLVALSALCLSSSVFLLIRSQLPQVGALQTIFPCLIFLSAPIGVHHLGAGFWVHDLVLLVTALGLWGLSNQSFIKRRILFLSILLLPFISWFGVLISAALSLLAIKGSLAERKRVIFIFSTAIGALSAWFVLTFAKPAEALTYLVSRGYARSGVGGPEWSPTSLAVQLLLSMGLSGVFLIGLLALFLRSVRKDKALLNIVLLGLVLLVELLVLPNQTITYSFTHLLLLPLAVAGFSAALRLIESHPQSRLICDRFGPALIAPLAILVSISNYWIYLQIYVSAEGYGA